MKQTPVTPKAVVHETILATRPVAPRRILSVANAADLAELTNGAQEANRKSDLVLEYVATRKVDTKTGRLTLADASRILRAKLSEISAPPATKKNSPLKGVQLPLPLDAPKVEAKETVDRLVKVAATVAKKPAAEIPEVKNPFHAILLAAQFAFVQSEAGGYGYQHGDGRAVLCVLDTPSGLAGWTLLCGNTLKRSGKAVEALEKLLAATRTKRGLNRLLATDQRAVRTVAAQEEKARKAVAIAPADASYAEVLAAEKAAATPAVPEVIAGYPGNVVRAVEALGGLTLQQFNLDLLRGEKNYGKRLSLLKKLFNRDRVLMAETGITKLVEAFYSAVGVGDGKSTAARANGFAVRCKVIATAVRGVKAALKQEEKRLKKRVLRASVAERTVPGRIVVPEKTLTKAQRREKDATDRAAFVLAPTGDNPAIPHPEAEVHLVPGDVRLLEDPKNGIVMMQIEKSNSQGAICVYNNGVRVACGVVPPDKLKALRPVTGDVDLVKAANQLLNPIVPSVPVTPVAARHLTAVLHCKELVAMTPETATVAKSAKFAPPAKKSAAKTAKAAKAPAKKAAKKGGASERVRVVANEAATIKLVKNPGEGSKLAKRDKVIVEILQKAGKKMTLGALLKAMGKQIETNGRTMESVWAWHGSPRQVLIADGIISVHDVAE